MPSLSNPLVRIFNHKNVIGNLYNGLTLLSSFYDNFTLHKFWKSKIFLLKRLNVLLAKAVLRHKIDSLCIENPLTEFRNFCN